MLKKPVLKVGDVVHIATRFNQIYMYKTEDLVGSKACVILKDVNVFEIVRLNFFNEVHVLRSVINNLYTNCQGSNLYKLGE